MKRYKFQSLLFILALGIFTITSCTNSPKKETEETAPAATEAETTPREDTIRVELNANDQMQFDKSDITVYEGQTVVLTLTHTGKMPITAMGHNFVLLTSGTSIDEFAEQAITANKTGYIPTDHSHIIAYTDLIGGGQSTSVTFKAPEKGTYDFLCSFPGHHGAMKGKFIVE